MPNESVPNEGTSERARRDLEGRHRARPLPPFLDWRLASLASGCSPLSAHRFRMCVGVSPSAATKVLNRFFTHVHSLFETGITSRLILLEDSVKVNLEVQDKVRHRDIRTRCPELPARLSLFPLCPLCAHRLRSSAN